MPMEKDEGEVEAMITEEGIIKEVIHMVDEEEVEETIEEEEAEVGETTEGVEESLRIDEGIGKTRMNFQSSHHLHVYKSWLNSSTFPMMSGLIYRL